MFVASEPLDNCILSFETADTEPDQVESDDFFEYFEPRCID